MFGSNIFKKSLSHEVPTATMWCLNFQWCTKRFWGYGILTGHLTRTDMGKYTFLSLEEHGMDWVSCWSKSRNMTKSMFLLLTETILTQHNTNKDCQVIPNIPWMIRFRESKNLGQILCFPKHCANLHQPLFFFFFLALGVVGIISDYLIVS